MDDAVRLRETLERLRRISDLASMEIVVSCGRSRDKSLAVGRELADRVVRTTKPGRARQMHQGALTASGDDPFFKGAGSRKP